MHKPQLEEKPGVASAEQGQVILDGPDGVAVAMTPDAARRTAQRLIAAADIAAGQSSEPSSERR
jgi:hypothetical protein